MNTNKRLPAKAIQRATSALAMVITAGALAGCKLSQTPPFDPKRIQQIQSGAAERTVPQFEPIPERLESSLTPERRPAPLPHIRATTQPYGQEVPMKLQEIIARTVANTLEARVAGYQSAIDEQRVLEAEARFDPLVFAEGQLQKQYPTFTGQSDETPLDLYTQSIEAGFRQLLTTGGQAEISYRVQRSGDFQSTGPFGQPIPVDPFYQHELALQLTQPLLRDFGAESSLARITVARNDQRISQLDFRDRVEDALANVERLYWQLEQARRDVDILQRLVRTSRETLDATIFRLDQDASRREISQVRASLEDRNFRLVGARARVQDLSDQIKAIMNDPEFPVAGPEVIVPGDDPMERPVSFALSDQIETAMQNRLELLQQLYRINSAGAVVKAAERNLLPRLDVTGSVGVLGFGPDFDDTLKQQDEFDFVTWAVGFQFEVPIGNRQNRAIYQRTLLQLQQSHDQYRLVAEQVAADVKIRNRDVQTQWDTFVAARRHRFAARDALDAYMDRRRGGDPLTPDFLDLELTFQENLARAALAENQALADYNIALSAVERAKGTLLRYNNVVLQEEKEPMFVKTAKIRENKRK